MTNIQAITVEHYSSKRWTRFTSYAFAAADHVCPVVVQELPRAIMAVPVAFIEVEGSYALVAVQSLSPGKNVFVSPDGRWIGRYKPENYICYPFVLGKGPDGNQILCIDEDSGLVSGDTIGEDFFDAEGKPSPIVSQILEFLTANHASKHATLRVCGILKEKGLIQPWPVTIKLDSGDKAVEGLYRVDEEALNNLAAEELLELRDAGALSVAYCQLLSMLHMRELAKIESDSQNSGNTVKQDELNLDGFDQSGSLSFDNI